MAKIRLVDEKMKSSIFDEMSKTDENWPTDQSQKTSKLDIMAQPSLIAIHYVM